MIENVLYPWTVGIAAVIVLCIFFVAVTFGLAAIDDKFGKDTHKLVLFFGFLLMISYPIGKILVGMFGG